MKVAIYTRVSTDQQAKEGDSLREQETSLVKYANDKGWEIVDIYSDEGISGTKNKRDDYQRLMEDVQAGKIDIIIFTFLYRWFRNLRHYLNTQSILNKHNVAWKAIHEEFYDTTTPMGRMFVNVTMAIGELEPEMTSERIKAVFEHKIANGEVVSGSVPLGFSIQAKETGKGKILVPNQDANIVRDVFNHYIEFGSMHQTVRFLYDQYGIERDYQSVSNMLRNKKYIGVHRDNKHYCPQIIDGVTFDTVQNMLSKNIKSNTKRVFIFSGLVKCASCGGSFTGTTRILKYTTKTGNVKKEYKQHRCNNYRRSVRRCDNTKSYNESFIENYLLENIQTELKQHMINQKPNSAVKKPDNSAQIKKINSKLERLKVAYLNEIIELEEYKKDREALLEQLATLEEKPKIIAPEAFKTVLDNHFKTTYKRASEEEKRSLWRSVIDKVIVDHQGNIKIVFLS